MKNSIPLINLDALDILVLSNNFTNNNNIKNIIIFTINENNTYKVIADILFNEPFNFNKSLNKMDASLTFNILTKLDNTPNIIMMIDNINKLLFFKKFFILLSFTFGFSSKQFA